jgi:hypothetical protein
LSPVGLPTQFGFTGSILLGKECYFSDDLSKEVSKEWFSN